VLPGYFKNYCHLHLAPSIFWSGCSPLSDLTRFFCLLCRLDHSVYLFYLTCWHYDPTCVLFHFWERRLSFSFFETRPYFSSAVVLVKKCHCSPLPYPTAALSRRLRGEAIAPSPFDSSIYLLLDQWFVDELMIPPLFCSILFVLSPRRGLDVSRIPSCSII
jgi:hypothetical protein